MGTRLIRGTCLYVLCVISATGAHADSLDDAIRAELKAENVPSLTLAVFRNGKIIKSAAYGIANLEWNERATTDTRYEIASISKMFTGEAIRLLTDEGKLSLEDPVSKFFAGLPENWNGMKIRHLLTMSSGLPEDWGGDLIPYSADVMTLYDDPSMLKAFSELKMEAPVGQEFHYSGPGYAMLGMIIQQVSGQPFATYIENHLFKPAGMTHSTYIDPFAVVPKRAEGYRQEKGQLRRGRRLSPYLHARADVGILSTAEDMAKWVMALREGRIIKDPERLWKETVSDAGHALDYNYGWSTGPFHGHRALYHSGGFRTGFHTIVYELPADDLGFVILSNSDFTDLGRFATLVASHYLPDVRWSSVPEHDESPAETARLIGAISSLGKAVLDPDVFVPNALEPVPISTLQHIVPSIQGLKFESRKRLSKPLAIHGNTAVRTVTVAGTMPGQPISLSLYLDSNGKVVYIEPG